MGNTIGGKNRSNKTAKVMKTNGETMKLKTPVKAGEVMKDYPDGFALMESESVKHYGIRSKALEPHQDLLPKRLYFLVELPKPREEKFARRVRSGINMSAKDRLESLMLARRSTSDLSIMKPAGFGAQVEEESGGTKRRITMRLPKAEVERLMRESRDEDEAASKIVELCMRNRSKNVDEETEINGGLVQETFIHLTALCRVSREVLSRIWIWFGVVAAVPDTFVQLWNSWEDFHYFRPPEARRMWDLLLYAYTWSIWKARNACVLFFRRDLSLQIKSLTP